VFLEGSHFQILETISLRPDLIRFFFAMSSPFPGRLSLLPDPAPKPVSLNIHFCPWVCHGRPPRGAPAFAGRLTDGKALIFLLASRRISGGSSRLIWKTLSKPYGKLRESGLINLLCLWNRPPRQPPSAWDQDNLNNPLPPIRHTVFFFSSCLLPYSFSF